MSFRLSSAGCLVVLLSCAPRSQVRPDGDGTVEFFGLEHRTPEQLQEGLRKGEPEARIHYCAAVIVRDLQMADAAVVCHMENMEDARGHHTIVTVVEPENASRVQWRPEPKGPKAPVGAWSALRKELSDAAGCGNGIGGYRSFAQDGEAKALQRLHADPDEEPAAVRAWHAIAERSAATDGDLAAWTLATDPDVEDRVCAAAVLLNFPDRDLTWWTLVDGLRDGDASVRQACGRALDSLARMSARRVDWRPAAGSLRLLLGGTNLFAFEQLLQLLVATKVQPELAAPLLADNAHLVLAYHAAQYDALRAKAHALLAALRGADPGPRHEEWVEWVRGLATGK